MTAIGLKAPPRFVTNEWAWAYTLDKLTSKGLVDGGGNPTNYAAAVAIYKRVAAKYGDMGVEMPVAHSGAALTRAELIECDTDTWLASRGFAWAANDRFTARIFHAGAWFIERVTDDGTATTSPIEEFDTVQWLLRDAPAAHMWATDQELA